MHALILCDDLDEAAILSLVVQRVGASRDVAIDVDAVLKDWRSSPADLVLLALREVAPIQLVRRFRRETEAALAMIVDGDEGLFCAVLDAGADRVFGRPYSARLLIMELRALMRRAEGRTLATLPILAVGDLSLDPETRMVGVGDDIERRLTPLEFRLLYTLMIHRGQTLPAGRLIERVWGYQGEGNPELVRGLISRLRAKIEDDPRDPRYIRTVPGLGYCLRDVGE